MSTPPATLFPYRTLFPSKPRRALPTAGRSRSRRRPVGKTASRSARTRQSPPASSRASSRRYREKRRRGRVWQRGATDDPPLRERRSEEHTSELPSLMRNQYHVFSLKNKTHTTVTPR